MTEFQKEYRNLIVAVDGRKGVKFEEATKEHRESCAGIALTASVLSDGNIKLQHLKSKIPDFSQSEIRTALNNLRKSGFFVFDRKDKLYRVALTSEQDEKDGVSATDGVVWALLGAVAQGWIKRA